MTLTVYSSDFEDGQGMTNGGFGGQCFVEDKTDGVPFSNFPDNILAALRHIKENGIRIERMVYNFKENGEQRFIALDFKNASWCNDLKTRSALNGEIHLGHGDEATSLRKTNTNRVNIRNTR